MHIRMKTLLAGPAGVFPQGSVQLVSDERGQELIDSGFAELADAEVVEVELEASVIEIEAVIEPEEALVELVGAVPAARLAEHGYPTVEGAQGAISGGIDLTEIEGVGRATVRKLEAE